MPSRVPSSRRQDIMPLLTVEWLSFQRVVGKGARGRVGVGKNEAEGERCHKLAAASKANSTRTRYMAV